MNFIGLPLEKALTDLESLQVDVGEYMDWYY